MWTIYWSPKDHPGKFVVRRCVIEAGRAIPSNDYALAPTLEWARAHVPPGLCHLLREPNDEAQIVESWI